MKGLTVHVYYKLPLHHLQQFSMVTFTAIFYGNIYTFGEYIQTHYRLLLKQLSQNGGWLTGVLLIRMKWVK